MITSRHQKWADRLFGVYLNRLFRRHFYTIRLLDPVPDLNNEKPVLVLPNHSTWWDGFFFYYLNKYRLHRRIYLMMLESQLRRNRFFRFLGAYSVHTGSYTGVRKSLEYTLSLLNRPQEPAAVCVFPQGELQPWHVRPVTFRRGLAFILKNIHTEIELCFLGIRVEYRGEQRPDVYLQMSHAATMIPGASFSLSGLQSGFNEFLDTLEKRITRGDTGTVIFRGKKSVDDRYSGKRNRGE